MSKSFWGGSLLALVLLCTTTSPVYASTVVRSGESVDLKDDQRVDGNFYVLAGAASLSGTVTGDVSVAAGTITVNGPINKDALLIATNVGVYASVTDDVRIVAGVATIGDEVKGSLFVIGGELKILSTAKIDGDVFFLGGSLQSDGEIGGAVLGKAESIRVDGKVGKGVDVEAVTLTLGDKARVTSGIAVATNNDVVRAPGAVVEGEIVKTKPAISSYEGLPYKTMAITFATSLFAALFLYLVARRFVERFVTFVLSHAGSAVLVGVGLIPATFLLAIIVIATGLGVFLGIGILSVLGGVLMFAFPLSSIIAGTIAARIVVTKPVINSLTIAAGALLVQLLLLVPIIGIILCVALFVMTFGGLCLAISRVAKQF